MSIERYLSRRPPGDADALLGLELGLDGEEYLIGDNEDGALALDLRSMAGVNGSTGTRSPRSTGDGVDQRDMRGHEGFGDGSRLVHVGWIHNEDTE